MNGTPTLERLRLLGPSGGAIFVALALVAYLTNTGPSSDDGVTVVQYFSTHGTATLWGAALVGIAMIWFIWFAETFAGRMPREPWASQGRPPPQPSTSQPLVASKSSVKSTVASTSPTSPARATALLT